MTIRQWLEEFAAETNETVTHLCLGKRVNPKWPPYPANVARPVDEFGAILDFDSDYVPDLCGWSPSWVVFADVYDGWETLQWVPRSPVDHTPVRPGG